MNGYLDPDNWRDVRGRPPRRELERHVGCIHRELQARMAFHNGAEMEDQLQLARGHFVWQCSARDPLMNEKSTFADPRAGL